MTFFVHESVVTPTSSFFKTILFAPSQETSKNRIVRLDRCDPDAFRLYLQWLYTGKNPVNGLQSSVTKCETLLLGKAYFLGDRLVDATFKDVIANSFSGKSTGQSILCAEGCRSCLNMISYVYDKTLESSPIRHLLVCIYSQYAKAVRNTDFCPWLFSNMAEGLPREFLLAVMRRMLDPTPQAMGSHGSSHSDHGSQGCLQTPKPEPESDSDLPPSAKRRRTLRRRIPISYGLQNSAWF